MVCRSSNILRIVICLALMYASLWIEFVSPIYDVSLFMFFTFFRSLYMKALLVIALLFCNAMVLFAQTPIDEDEDLNPLCPCGCGCNKRSYGGIHAGYAAAFLSDGISLTMPDGSSRALSFPTSSGFTAGIGIEQIVGSYGYLNNALYLNLLYTHYNTMENSFAYEQKDNNGREVLSGTAVTRLQASFVSLGAEYRHSFGRSHFGVMGGISASLLTSHSFEQYITLQQPAAALTPEGWEYHASSGTLVKNEEAQAMVQRLHASLTAGVEYQIVMRQMTIVPSLRYSLGITNLYSSQSGVAKLGSINAGVDWRFAL